MTLPLSQPGVSKQRMSSDQRRAAIVEAAVKLFAQNGFQGTTTRQLAAAVGVSEPVLYMHFETKRELYSAIIESILSKGTVAAACIFEAAKVGDDATFFRNLAQAIFNWYAEEPARVRLLLFSALEGHELSDLFYQQHFVPFFQALAAHIRFRIEEGTFRCTNPEIGARAFCGMIANYAQSVFVFKVEQSAEAVRTSLDGMVEIFLAGMKKES